MSSCNDNFIDFSSTVRDYTVCELFLARGVPKGRARIQTATDIGCVCVAVFLLFKSVSG